MAFDDVLYVGARPADEAARARVQKNWAWYVVLGFALAALGALAMSASTVTTFIAIRLFGWALLAAGLLEVGGAFWHDRWRGFSLTLVAGVFYLVVGTAVVVAGPTRSAMALTLLVAVFLTVQGALRVIVSIAHRDPGWGWTLFHGLVALALGVMVWAGWPVSGTWVLGLFVGVEMLLTGITVAMVGVAAHREEARAEHGGPGEAHAPVT